MTVTLSHLAMVLGAFFWAASMVSAKLLIDLVPASEIAVVRFLIGATILWLVVIASRVPMRVHRVGSRFLILGMAQPGLVTMLTYWGLQYTSAIHGTVIFSLFPLIALLLGRAILKEPITRPVVAGAAIALTGTVLLVADSGGGPASLLGDSLIAFSILLMGFGQLLLRRVAQRHDVPVVISAYQLAGGALGGFAAMAFESGPRSFDWIAIAAVDTWALLVFLGVFVSAGGFFLYNAALRHIPVGHISLYLVLMTPIGVPLAALVLGESIGWSDGFAIALVVIGVALPSLAGLSRSRRARLEA